MRTVGGTDRHYEANSRFRNFADASKNPSNSISFPLTDSKFCTEAFLREVYNSFDVQVTVYRDKLL